MTTAADKYPSVAVVVLNWNAWGDTIECLESVLKSNYSNFWIVLCDNGSTDGSLEKFIQWAERRVCALPVGRHLAQFSIPPAQAFDWHVHDAETPRAPSKITILDNKANIGFAAGNNTGIQYAVDNGAEFVWLLNADTVVTPSTLPNLVVRARSDADIGLCGSLLCYYSAPNVIQEAGGCTYYPLLGLARRIAAEQNVSDAHDWRAIEKKLGYISGASLLVTRQYVKEIGPMSEDYFLYCEEIDWATRGRDRFSMALAGDSVVYHKKGRATGSKSYGEDRSPGSAYYLWRARRRFTAKFHKFGLPGLFVSGFLSWVLARLKGNRDLARAGLDGLLDRPR